jgi:acyl-CoA thioesterase
MADAHTIKFADPQTLAEAVAAAMFERDAAAQAMGITVDAIGPGHARLSMTVRPDMLNGHGMCHGGFIFALADTCFAYACNTGNRVTVASACSIDYLAPGRAGTRLQADARVRSKAGRTGVYDIDITDADGTLIAMFRGKSYRIAGEVIPGAGTPD